MQIFLFFALIIAILAILFAVQNNAPVEVTFAVWNFEGSLALVLLVAMAAGAVISFFASLPTNIKVRWTLRNQTKKMAQLEADLAEHKQKVEETQKSAQELEKETQPQEGEPEDKQEDNESQIEI